MNEVSRIVQQNAIIAAASVKHKQNQNSQFHSNNTSHFYNSSNPGAINLAFGGAMMGSMLIFFLWMCYFCRCKDSKPDETSSITSTTSTPYWIDININELDPEDRATFCTDYENEHTQEYNMRPCTPPPTYDTIFNKLPSYEEACREGKLLKSEDHNIYFIKFNS